MGRTRKPCPGCGEIVMRRPANEVCRDCRRLIRVGKLLERQQKRRFGRQYNLPFASHALPYIPNCHDESLRQFRAAFAELCVAVSVEPAKQQYTVEDVIPGSHSGYGGDVGSVYLEPAARDTLRELYSAVEAMAREAYKEGKEEGESFVRGLCSGDVSLRELNESTIGEGRV